MRGAVALLGGLILICSPLAAIAGSSVTGFDGTSGSFTDTQIASGASFNDDYDFVTGGGDFNITVDTASPGFNFTSVLFNGMALSTVVPGIFYSSFGVPVTSGTQVVTVDGTYTGPATGSYSGDVHFTPAVSAAPEPSAWLLMMAGVGGIGLMLRRAKKTMGFRFRDAFAA